MELSPSTIVVLWSPHQKQFHIETFGEMQKTNLKIYFRQALGDYIFLAFAESRKEAHKIIEDLEARQIEYSDSRKNVASDT